jgi:hypothetical protein
MVRPAGHAGGEFSAGDRRARRNTCAVKDGDGKSPPEIGGNPEVSTRNPSTDK